MCESLTGGKSPPWLMLARIFAILSTLAVFTSGETPEPRYGHCAFVVNGTMFVLGGETAGGVLSAELWAFSLRGDSEGWSRVAAYGTAPPPIVGEMTQIVGSELPPPAAKTTMHMTHRMTLPCARPAHAVENCTVVG
eukprot:m.131566 g.131566  ORF g.131566 m.131566 type:complete len:137 (-) comp13760_c0_seq2:2361-2771(-)